MTLYALIENGAVKTYPYGLGQLRKDYKDVSFSEDVATAMQQAAFLGVVEVAPVTQPAYDETKDIVEGTPVLVGGTWTQVWNQPSSSAETIAARQRASADAVDLASVKADTFVRNFLAMTPAQITAYLNANVTDLASARAHMAKQDQMLLILARQVLRNGG